jgi:hypothetical protein
MRLRTVPGMARQRSVIIAGAVSGVLVSASAAFAIATGLVGGTAADAVGSFEQVSAVVPTVPAPASAPGADPLATTTAPASVAVVAPPNRTGERPGPSLPAGDDVGAAPSGGPGVQQPVPAADPGAPTTTTAAEHHDGETSDHVGDSGEHERHRSEDDGHEDDD